MQREADAEEARAYKTLYAEVGKSKGRRSDRAAPTKDRKAHNQDDGKEAELCTEGMGPEPVPQIGAGAHLAWIARNGRKLKEECRSGGSGNKGNEKGNGKEEGKHLEEFKRNVEKTREAVEETKSRLAEAPWKRRGRRSFHAKAWALDPRRATPQLRPPLSWAKGLSPKLSIYH